MSRENFRVALVQMSCSADPDANLDKGADRVREAARAGANVVCLPELFRTQYFCQREDHALFDLAEPIPGPSTERLSRIAKEEHVAVFAISPCMLAMSASWSAGTSGIRKALASPRCK